MKRLIIFLMLVLSCVTAMYGQTADAPQKPDANYVYEPIREGDQSLRLSIGTLFPLAIYGPDGFNTTTNLDVGGAGAISYTRFITSKIALGGGITFAFHQTLAENVYFFLPLTLKASYEMVFDQIHVPVGMSIGGAFQTYNGANYFGLYIHPEAGIYWQQSPDWSFGLDVGLSIIPQNYENDANDRTGYIMDTLIGFRYHF
jgi:hypothetical protein